MSSKIDLLKNLFAYCWPWGKNGRGTITKQKEFSLSFPNSRNHGTNSLIPTTVCFFNPYSANVSYSTTPTLETANGTETIQGTSPDKPTPWDILKSLVKDNNRGLSTDIVLEKINKGDSDPDHIKKKEKERLETLTTHALYHIGYRDSNDFFEGKTPEAQQYAYLGEFKKPEEAGKLMLKDNNMLRKSLISELFRQSNGRYDFKKYQETFLKKLACYSARRIARELLLLRLKLEGLSDPLKTDATNYLNTKDGNGTANYFAIPDDTDIKDINKILEILKFTSNGEQENRKEIQAILHLMSIRQRDFIKDLEELEKLPKSTQDRVKRINECIKHSPKAFSYVLNTFDRLLELEGIQALDSPNKLSNFLDSIENSVLSLEPNKTVKPEETIDFQKSRVNISEATKDAIDPENNFPAYITTLLEDVKKETVQICEQVLKEEKATIEELRKADEKEIFKSRRLFNKTTAKIAVAATVLVGIPGTIGTVAYFSHLSRKEKIQILKDRIKSLIDFNGLYKNACERAKEGMVIELEGKRGDDIAREWNGKVFRKLATFLEPKPTDNFLKGIIEDFIITRNENNRTALEEEIRRFPADTKELNSVRETLSRFLINQISSDSLALELSRLNISTIRHLPAILQTHRTRVAISQRQVNLPPQILQFLTNDLTNIFGDDYFRVLPASLVTRSSPLLIIGPGAISHDTSKGRMVDLLMGLPFYTNDNPLARTRRNDLFTSWRDMHTRIRNSSIEYVNGVKRDNDYIELTRLLTEIEQVKDLDIIEQNIQSIEENNEVLKKVRNIMIPAYATCLTGFEVVEEKNGQQILEPAVF